MQYKLYHAQLAHFIHPSWLSLQVPGFEGNGYLLGGSESWGPGVFSPQLTPKEVNASEVVLMTTNATTFNWLRLKSDGGNFPENLDSPSVAVDATSGVVYYFGGRRLEEWVA